MLCTHTMDLFLYKPRARFFVCDEGCFVNPAIAYLSPSALKSNIKTQRVFRIDTSFARDPPRASGQQARLTAWPGWPSPLPCPPHYPSTARARPLAPAPSVGSTRRPCASPFAGALRLQCSGADEADVTSLSWCVPVQPAFACCPVAQGLHTYV